MRVLLVEDDEALSQAVCGYLRAKDFVVDAVPSLAQAGAALHAAQYAAVLLDLHLTDGDGLSLLPQLRGLKERPIVIVLTARDQVSDRIHGLDAGADDYLVKPFDFDELLARLRAMTRKHVGQRTNTLTVGDLTLDTAQRRVTRDGEEIALLPKEFAILEYLMRHPGTVLSREQIEDQIWNYEYAGSSNNVDGYLSRLRKKIDEGRGEKLLHTVRGMGWAIRPPAGGKAP